MMFCGRYKILREVGRGAMGIVYQALDPQIDRLIALKVLRQDRSDNEAFVSRFIKEARSAGRLSHPGIVTIHDVGEDSGNVFIAMEFLEGQTLAQFARDRSLDAHLIVNFGIQIAEALHHAHERGVVHRDIKPSNIVVQEGRLIKITDFGIARFDDPKASMQTQTGEILGTPSYMSPEQVLGRVVDGRSDLFSLGVILFELLTGQRPFGGEGKTLGSIFNEIVQNPPPEALLSGIQPPRLAGAISIALQKDPGKRFQTGMEFAQALKAVLSPSLSDSRSAQSPPRKRLVLAMVGLALSFAVLVGILVFLLQKPSAPALSNPPVQYSSPSTNAPGPFVGQSLLAPVPATSKSAPTVEERVPSPVKAAPLAKSKEAPVAPVSPREIRSTGLSVGEKALSQPGIRGGVPPGGATGGGTFGKILPEDTAGLQQNAEEKPPGGATGGGSAGKIIKEKDW